MTDNYFKPAQRHKLPLKLALFGPSKAGKTFTALKLMRGIVGPDGKFAVVDTENRGTEEYQGDPEVGDFDIAALSGNYAPERYAKIMSDVVAFGYQGLVIDGISPAWDGPGGVQAIADANTQGQNKFSGWQVASPEHAKLLQAILHCPIHLICTMRSKTEYVVEQGKPKKVGLKPVQRDGIEYEFRLLGEMDADNNLKITGRRNFQNRVIPMPGPELAQELLHYLGSEQAIHDDAHAQREAQDRAAEGQATPADPDAGSAYEPRPDPTTTMITTPAEYVAMIDPSGKPQSVPVVSVAALTAAGWLVATDPTPPSSPITPAAPSLDAAPSTATAAPVAALESAPTPTSPPDPHASPATPGVATFSAGQAAEVPPTNAPPTTSVSGGAGPETGAAPASQANAAGGATITPEAAPTPSASPTNGQTEPSSPATNGTTASNGDGTKMEASQLQKIVELCQELAVLKPDKGDANWWLEWANKKATEEYHQDFSEMSRDAAAGLIERIEKTKLALRDAA